MKSRSVFAASGKAFRTKNISKRVQKTIISPIKELSILADDFFEKTGRNPISFGQGVPYLDTPSFIKDKIKKALARLRTAKYSLEPGITELRELVARHIQTSKNLKNVQAKEEVMITVGAQEAVFCSLASTVDDGDEVLLISPAYASHIEQVIQSGGDPKFVQLQEKEGWRLDMGELEKKTTKKTKVILFSNPSNPTGKVFTKKELTDLARFAKAKDLIVIVDETYDFLTYDGAKHISLASIGGIRDRVILCGSFSKKYALTGYRIGYAFADKGIIDHMLKIHDALAICAPTISQEAAIAALKGKQDSVLQFIKEFTRNRELMCEKLDQMDEYFEYQKPMGAYYVFPKFKNFKINSTELALRILYEAGVIVVPGTAFGPSGEKHLRFSFACSPQEIEEGFKRLRRWFDSLKLTAKNR